MLKDGYCHKCGTNWDGITKKTNELNNIDSYENQNVINEPKTNINQEQNVSFKLSEEDINKNIRFFLTWGSIVLCIFILTGIISFIAILASARHADEVILPALGALLGSILSGVIMNNVLKWFAYMLYTNKRK